MMKKILFALLVALSFVACVNNPKGKAATDEAAQPDRVEVLVFYGKQRCPTCRAIEEHSREVVERDFAAQLERGELVFRVVDIDADEALADKYEVVWSSLYLVGRKEGNESAENLTEFAFANARNNPDAFKQALKHKIDELLK